ncbi:neutral/alkaline non-lysosomal ceramidase N-terminal domain-containing protein [Paenibacillus ginsengarvi]|nr:neutral/alkaline non-lysosomal ceramidase N-terminal domain-containing protein [Paenibacillus ginsengarvi]
MSLEIGSAKVDITPEQAVPLAGFAVRQNKPFEDVHSRLYLRALYLRERKEDGTVSNAVIVSADLLWWGSDRVPIIRQKLHERWGLEPAAIVLNGTHSHSGPQTSFVFHRLLGQADAGYVDFLENRLYEAIGQAERSAEPVALEKGVASSDIGIQRRLYKNGKVAGGYNPDGPADPEVTVIRARTERGTTKAVIVHYTCHPVTTNVNRVSSEFTGAAMDKLETRLGGQTVCLFLQGACGDINIFKSSAPAELTDEYAIIDYFGSRLADTVSGVLDAEMRRLEPAVLKGTACEQPLPLKRLPGREQLEQMAAKGESPYDEWAVAMLAMLEERPQQLVLEMNRLDIAEGLSLLVMNAEVVVEYGLFLKERSGGQILPVPYSNGMIGYVPTKKQIGYGGYEPVLSTYYFHMPSTFEESIEETIRARIGEIVRE